MRVHPILCHSLCSHRLSRVYLEQGGKIGDGCFERVRSSPRAIGLGRADVVIRGARHHFCNILMSFTSKPNATRADRSPFPKRTRIRVHFGNGGNTSFCSICLQPTTNDVREVPRGVPCLPIGCSHQPVLKKFAGHPLSHVARNISDAPRPFYIKAW